MDNRIYSDSAHEISSLIWKRIGPDSLEECKLEIENTFILKVHYCQVHHARECILLDDRGQIIYKDILVTQDTLTDLILTCLGYDTNRS